MGTNKLSDSVQSRRVMIARQTARWNAIVTEHRIISRIIHALTNHGAFNIARTSLPAWNYIWKDRTHWVELNRRIYCDGSGVRERKALLSKYSLPHIPCAAAHLTCSSSLRPCIRCGKIVCDDCRTHLLYQSFFESWSKPTNSRYPQCVLKLLQELGSVVTISSPPPKPVILDHEVAPFPPSFRGSDSVGMRTIF
ncbi:hypothetical protein P280DRAFT_131657 [Massarina eburnea CBS 473.64]|uniref:Uncharacterized protein n=1 Tax=Massarina eburnea CBS 473.64 TaxID=1395130 RepID=A0A6A6SFR2_9PLEO|nr:hypothetical protein P280DRAFT_131657 [Massarina eburnea CBS 473.64]